jgi:hypothetical protein
MRATDPLPQLLRLHGSVTRVAPSPGTKLTASDAAGLAEAYSSMRVSARRLAIELGVDAEAFDQELPELGGAPFTNGPGMRAQLALAEHAASAATRLRQLRGYLEGLLAMSVLTEDLSAGQAAAIERALAR